MLLHVKVDLLLMEGNLLNNCAPPHLLCSQVLFLNIHDVSNDGSPSESSPSLQPHASQQQLQSAQGAITATEATDPPALTGFAHLHTIATVLATCFEGVLKEEGRWVMEL